MYTYDIKYESSKFKMNIPETSFDFIDCGMTRNCMKNGYWAMDQTSLWNWLRSYEVDPSRGFMFANDPEIKLIDNVMERNDAPIIVSHSGASFGFTMCNLHYIAKNGFEAYKALYLENKRKREKEQIHTGGNE